MENENLNAIEFLQSLGTEMKNQDKDSQADPRFWVVAQSKQNSICENTLFLTKSECKKHIELNHYHYNNPHSYAMTAWRSPQVEKLYEVLKSTDWEKVKMAIAALEQQEKDIGCNICNSDEIKKLLIMKQNDSEYLACVGGNSQFPKENHAKFCPKCGKKLEEERK